MRLLVSLFAAILLWGCDAAGPTSPDPSLITPEEEAAYAEDAAVLAFRHQLAAGDSQSVELPQSLVADLADVLVRVRTSEHGGLIEGIRARADRSPVRLLVGVESEAGWAAAWRAGDVATGDEAIDGLVETYGLSLERYSEALDWGVLVAPRPLNTVALGRRFEAVAGVRYAEPDGLVGDGDDVELGGDGGGGWVLVFSRGSGDCPSGCIDRTYWTFRVVGETVEYLGSRDR